MLYHYTSARLLEKIIASGVLKPSMARGGRLLWATSAPTIDLTSAYHHEPIVARFTLHDCDFEPWTDVRARYQQEEMQKEADRLEPDGLKYGSRHINWYVRFARLPSDRWLRSDTRDQRWQPYQSKTWRKRGSPQLARMPWYTEDHYKYWGIDLGQDPTWMDDEGIADWHYNNLDEDAIAECRYRFEKDD